MALQVVFEEVDGKQVQWGAHVALWVCSVSQDPNVDFFSDPYQPMDGHQDGQSSRTKSDGSYAWNYVLMPTSAFQDTVRMVRWKKQKGWDKKWDGCPKRIDKYSIHKRDQSKVRNFVYRFQEDG